MQSTTDTAEDVIMTGNTTPSQPHPTRTNHDWQPQFEPDPPLVQSRPHASQNIITLYDLTGIESTVRRVDPVSKEKINKIRKSYEGKVKQLGIAGVNKALSTPLEFIGENEETGEPIGLLNIPQEEWVKRHSGKKSIRNGMTPDILNLLDSAVEMAPGKLSDKEGEKYKKLMSVDEPPKAKVAAQPLQKSGVVSQAQSGHPSAAPSPNLKAQNLGQIARPARAGAKRRYNDTTFKGYGEGFVDDDMTNMSEEESREAGLRQQKRRRKVNTTMPPKP
ncbi:mediator complex, subunit MED19 [Tothia fuscella]|uniref:Mediator of RNA polymerase II transcription subunit 19 n=1 Tax=Tothia fuscella TaxID=1048955 RepID=A0A9P4TX39_9PEZI|nr:mediator complex, subunit MED19 [Tothia fuscella]